jgi:uncharacterized membrane protein
MRARRSTEVVLVGALLLAACGGSESVNCPNLSTTCPSPQPSYANDVRPIVNARCTVCHSPGGQEASRDLTTYSHVFEQRQAVLTQVFSCRMPPSDAPQPTAQERSVLVSWLVCGAPNN